MKQLYYMQLFIQYDDRNYFGYESHLNQKTLLWIKKEGFSWFEEFRDCRFSRIFSSDNEHKQMDQS